MTHDRKHELFRGTRPRVFSTRPDDPEEGRIFVWAWTKWFERLEGASGAVDFTHVADSEEELHRWLAQQGIYELSELDGEFCALVRQEFVEQVPLYPEAPETSSEEPFREQLPGEDIEHF